MKKVILWCITTLMVMAPSYSQQPNIIWITCEDISPYIGAFGDTVVKTPNIDKLSKEGVKYTSVYTTAGVCSPSRSAIITGMYQTSIGTQHMRTEAMDPKFSPPGLPSYAAVIPAYVKAFPEYLRKEGYYTSNNQKEDHQFTPPVTVWDESSPAANYRNRKERQPFFSVFNLMITHESQVMSYPELTVRPEDVKIPNFYEDTPTTRKDIANLLTRIETMDKHVGHIIDRLKKDGLYDNSYIFFFSDHGGNLPWMKREILERGTHIPFVVKYPKGKNGGTTISDLISAVDFAPTVLSLAGIKPPSYVQGQAFMGKYASKEKRKYVFAARDRMDELYDRVRSVRDYQFRYVYNYMPNQPKYQDLVYRKNIPMMQEILDRKDKGEISNPYLLDWFAPTKPQEELYDVTNDPDEVHNLVNDPAYSQKLQELRKTFRNWEKEVGDLSAIPEKEMVINRMWKGAKEIPMTAEPQVIVTRKGIKLKCNTEGASIGYRILKVGERDEKIKRNIWSWDYDVVIYGQKNGNEVVVRPTWNVYNGEVIRLKKGERLMVNAMRIGYKPSEITYTQD